MSCRDAFFDFDRCGRNHHKNHRHGCRCRHYHNHHHERRSCRDRRFEPNCCHGCYPRRVTCHCKGRRGNCWR